MTNVFEIKNGVYRIGNSVYFLIIKQESEELVLASEFENWKSKNTEKYFFGFRHFDMSATEATRKLQRENRDSNIIVAYNPGTTCKTRCEFVSDLL